MIKQNCTKDSVSNLEFLDSLQQYHASYQRSLKKQQTQATQVQEDVKKQISGCLKKIGITG